MICLKTGRHILQSGKTAQQKSCADEQEHGHGDLRRDERSANAMVARPGGGTSRTFIQRFTKDKIRGAQGGHDSKEKSGYERNEERKKKNPPIKTHGEHHGYAGCRKFQEWTQRGPGKEQSQLASGEGKQQAFGDQLAGDTPARGAHGSSNGHLPAP